MRFRLGRFKGVSEHFAPEMVELLSSAIAGIGSAGRDDTMVATVYRMMQSTGRETDRPCLLESLSITSPDRAWLEPTLEALTQADDDGAGIALLACEADEGPDAPFVVVATAFRRHAEVRRGDVVCSGFALRRRPDTGLELFPRFFRVACANGSIQHAGTFSAGELEPDQVHDAVTDLLGRRALDSELARLREAAARRVEDPLRELQRARLAESVGAAHTAFERGRDRSYWGLLNAVTSAARGQRDWSRRLDEEQGAGGVLALLEPQRPQRPAGLALQPPPSAEQLSAHA